MSIRLYTVNVGPNSSERLDVSGSMVYVMESTASVLLGLDGEATFPVERGLKFKRDYRNVSLQNNAATGAQVKLALGDGDMEDFRPQNRPQIPSTTTNLWDYLPVTGMTPGTANLVEGANPSRTEFLILAPSTNVGSVVLQSGLTLGSGIKLMAPGEYFRLAYTGPLYIRSNSGAELLSVVKLEY